MNNEFDNRAETEDTEKYCEENTFENEDAYAADEEIAPQDEESTLQDEEIIPQEEEESIAMPLFPGYTVTHKVEKKKGMTWKKLVAMALAGGLIAGITAALAGGLFAKYIYPGALRNNVKLNTTDKVILNKDEESDIAGSSQTAKIQQTKAKRTPFSRILSPRKMICGK